MTCIVGIAREGVVVIGGDSLASDPAMKVTVRADRKVFELGSMIVGFTSSYRMGQLLQHAFSPPERKVGQDAFAYLVREFIPAVLRCFADGGWGGGRDGKSEGGEFLVGLDGRLFCVHSDFQVAEPADGYYAVGSGAEFALGAVFASRWLDHLDRCDPDSLSERVRLALVAAEKFSGAVRGPFHLVRHG